MSSGDLNAALENLHDAYERTVLLGEPLADHVAGFLDAIPEGAVIVAITRDDVAGERADPFLHIEAENRIACEALAALEAQS